MYRIFNLFAAVTVLLLLAAGCGSDDSSADTTAPQPGNGITVTRLQPHSLTLNWQKATDETTPQSALRYSVYYSVNHYSDIAGIAANAQPVISGVSDISTLAIGSLSAGTLYYFYITAADLAGNLTLYNIFSAPTPLTADQFPPLPGISGVLSAASVQQNSLVLNWTKATDTVSAPNILQYRVYRSTESNFNSVADIEMYGTPLSEPLYDINSYTVTGLTTDTRYTFNVIVIDQGGNKTNYQQLIQKTAGPPDTAAPAAGTVTILSNTTNAVMLSWSSATDDTTSETNLQYLVYYSALDNLNSVSNIEANGTPSGSYTAGITNRTVSGLDCSTLYYFAVLVQDEAGNKAAYPAVSQTTADGNPPQPGNSGTLTATTVTSNGLTLNWSAANDDITAQSDLLYGVYISTNSVLDSVSEIEANGTLLTNWLTNLTSLAVSGLDEATSYYFNVIIKDEAGNKSNSVKLLQQTVDATAAQPGNSGTVTVSSIQSNQVSLYWTPASDNGTAQSALQYLPYYSTSSNINTVTEMEANGTAFGSYTADLTNITITGLTSATNYFFNIAVMDNAGNKTNYTVTNAATP